MEQGSTRYTRRKLVAMRLPPTVAELLRYTAKARGLSQADLVAELLTQHCAIHATVDELF